MPKNIGAMKIKKFFSGSRVEPETHIQLFRHCNGNDLTAHVKYFEETIRPLLMAHGIEEIKIL